MSTIELILDNGVYRMRRHIEEYGCCQCQAWHQKGDPLYDAHLYFQSKHGIRVRVE